jgi:TetR/AcrR family fatty acid metabolism transcriptional regulator
VRVDQLVYSRIVRSENRPDGLTFLEAARRAQIVQCAIESLAQDGYAGATMARIAERAKVSKSVIVYHFGTKDHVFEQVAAEVFRVATETVAPRVAGAPTATGRLRTYIEARIGFLATHREHMVALFEIWMNLRGPDGQLRFGEGDAVPTVDIIEQLLRTGQGAGEFAPFDPAVMAMAIRQAIDGVLLQLRARPDIDLDVYAREVADLFHRATSPPAMTNRTRRRT